MRECLPPKGAPITTVTSIQGESPSPPPSPAPLLPCRDEIPYNVNLTKTILNVNLLSAQCTMFTKELRVKISKII